MSLQAFVDEFMLGTRYTHTSPSPFSLNQPPPLEIETPADTIFIPLPAPAELDDIPTVDLRTAIEHRRSQRNYAQAPISLHELSFLLWCTQGVQKTVSPYYSLRTVPSACVRHAFETYLLVNQVEGLQPGLYYYSAFRHALAAFDLSADVNEKMTQVCRNQNHVRTSAVTFTWVAVAERMTWRCVERGYRYLFLDAGDVCQNLYLAAEAIHCGVCAIASYNDAEINQFLKLDGEKLFVIYLASLGKTA